MKMNSVVLIFLIIIGSYQLAQAQYRGGVGDGYASTELDLIPTGLRNSQEYEINIYPNPAKTFLILENEQMNLENTAFELIKADGKIIPLPDYQVISPAKIRIELPKDLSGLFVLHIRQQGSVSKSFKISILP